MDIRKHLKAIEDRLREITDMKFTFEVKYRNGELIVTSADYFAFQDQGVKGIKSGSSKAGYKFKKPYDLPASAFKDYTSDVSHQFAIARSIENKGIKAKEYTKDFDTDRRLYDIIADMYEEIIINKINNKL